MMSEFLFAKTYKKQDPAIYNIFKNNIYNSSDDFYEQYVACLLKNSESEFYGTNHPYQFIANNLIISSLEDSNDNKK